ncbi:MAG: acyl-CoA dehydrogenase family protein [Thermodesulfobacteriota bacterium]|nr:acyl-CoA dehydrogenase family protein [Thermodesulfobacteriota bacterium]
MDFHFSEEQELFRRTAARFAEKEIAPLVDELEQREEFPVELLRRMGELGFLGITYPEKYGGSGGNVTTLCIFLEEVGRISASVAIGTAVQIGGVSGPVFLFGTEDQKEKYLVPSIKGEKIGAIAMTEPSAGSDTASIHTSAKKGDNGYIIDGAKIFCTNGGIADLYFVTAVTDPKKGIKGISIFVIERGASGLMVGKSIRKLGLHGLGTHEVVFEGCMVDPDSLLGEEDKGFYNLMRSIERNRIGVAATAVGLAKAAFDDALQYAKERVQFGKPIGMFQGIQFVLADMAVDIELAATMVYKAAWMDDHGIRCNKEASIVKLYASEMVNRVTYKALQVFGGYGYMMEYPLQRYFRDARVFEIFEGTSEIQRVIISRELGL